MITYSAWQTDRCKGYRIEWEKFLATEAGNLGMQVIANRMLTERTRPSMDSKVIETTAIQGAQDDGYRQCYNNITDLQDIVVEARKRARPQTPDQPKGATLPISPEVRAAVDADPIYKRK